MTRPRTGFAYLDDPLERGAVVALAHRGGARHPDVLGLENTVAAFDAAVGLGFRYLETDVQATRDGELLAFHDDHLRRLTGRAGRICDHSYAELSSVRVSGREPIPRLADLLETFPRARFNVDLKTPGAVDPMVELVARMGVQDRVLVGSFTERVLRRFRTRMAARSSVPVPTSCGVATVAVARALPGTGRLRRLPALLGDTGAAYQVPHRHRGLRIVDRRFVTQAHAGGRHVHVWTVDDRAEMEHLLDMGVDGLITDRPDVLREVLSARGLWEGTT